MTELSCRLREHAEKVSGRCFILMREAADALDAAPTLTDEKGRPMTYWGGKAAPVGHKEPERCPTIRPEWIDQLANQYGSQQMAALRGDDYTARAANNWIHRIADDHWHEIIIALRRPPLSEEQPHGTTLSVGHKEE